jgi:Raf kinase inhibitor-like YbhB/YbcL family protein
MKLTSNSFLDGQAIPAEFAFCRPEAQNHASLSDNISPHLSWSDMPEGTRSLVLICYDPDVPSKPDDVNQEGRTVPADLPRVDFYHWVLVDIPGTVTELEAGADSAGVTPRGKDQTPGPHGARRGINSYTNWFTGDPDMGGDYFGYDGPCPPWNDSIPHHYVFTVYALDLETCPVVGAFEGPDVLKAIEGRVLDKASITGVYSLNPDVPV